MFASVKQALKSTLFRYFRAHLKRIFNRHSSKIKDSSLVQILSLSTYPKSRDGSPFLYNPRLYALECRASESRKVFPTLVFITVNDLRSKWNTEDYFSNSTEYFDGIFVGVKWGQMGPNFSLKILIIQNLNLDCRSHDYFY